MSHTAPGWRRVARVAGVVWIVWAVALTIFAGEVIVPVAIIAAVLVLAWLATEWKPNKISYTTFGVLSLLVVLLNAPFLVTDISHPESAIGFNTTTLPVLAALAGIGVGLSVWWRGIATAGPKTLAVLGAAFLVGLIVSVIAAFGLESDTPHAGDLDIVAKRADYTPESLTASAGTAGIFVENHDPFRHTFTMTELGIDIELPANTNRRVEVSLAPGTYQFHCRVPGHDAMTGVITVGG